MITCIQWKPVNKKKIPPVQELFMVKEVDKNSSLCMIKNINPHHKVLNMQYMQDFKLPHKNWTLASLIHQLDTIKNKVPTQAVPQPQGTPSTKGQDWPVQISKHKV